MISMRSSVRSALKLRDNRVKREQNPRHGHYNGFASGRESNLTPSRPTAINKLKLHRRNSEQCDHGRFLRIVLHAVIVRAVGNAPDEAAGRNSNGIFRIEIRPAIHPGLSKPP